MLIGCLINSNAAFGATRFTLTSANAQANGISASTITLGQTNIVLYGFSIHPLGGAALISGFNIPSVNSNQNSYFTNGSLWVNKTAATFSGATRVVSGLSIPSGGNISITGLSESVSNNKTYTYFFVADYTLSGPIPGSPIQFGFTTGQSPVSVISSNATYTDTALPGQVFNPIAITLANLTGGLAPSTTNLTSGTTNAMFGFSVTVSGAITISQFNINSSNSTLSTYFGSAKLYRSTTNNYTTGVLTQVGTATLNGAYVNVTGLSEAFSTGQTNYYFLVATDIFSTGQSSTVAFNFTSGQSANALTLSSPAVSYNIFNVSGSTYTIQGTTQTFDWIGQVSSDWNNTGNWSPHQIPQSIDIARIGVTQNYTNLPVVSGTGSTTVGVGSIIFGDIAGKTVGLTVNSGYILNVYGDISKQTDAQSFRKIPTFLTGSGTITAVNLNVKATFITSAFNYDATINSSIANLNLSGNLALTSNFQVIGTTPSTFNSTFNITGGIVGVGGIIQTTTNSANTTTTLTVTPTTTATLQLANATALSGLSSLGTNTISFNNTGATIEYSGTTAQTVYTDAIITGLPTAGPSYNSIKFSGSGIKTPNNGNLNIFGDFTNTLANDAGNYIALSTTPVLFKGTTQSLAGGAGNGTTFTTVTFSGLGTKTMASGLFAVSSTGVLTMSGSSASTVLDAGGFLTLNSDANGSAAVAAINGPKIIGNVNVQRYLTGNRGYRLVSSPVYGTTIGSTKVYSINYLKNTAFLTGTTDVPGGFDKAGNPTIYLYRENTPTSNASFTSGNFRGVNTIGTGMNYNYLIDGDGPNPFNIPVGTGFLFFFRGDRTAASLATETTPGYVATAGTLTTTGTLNQGNISVKEWYGASDLKATNTGFTLTGNPYACSINLDTYGTGIIGTNILSTVYVLNPLNKQYATYNLLNPILGTNGATNIVASGEAFFVEADPHASSASLTFTEAAKIPAGQQSTDEGNLMMGMPKDPYAVRQLLRLKLSLDSFNYDDIVIGFNSNSSAKYNYMEDSRYLAGMSAPEGLASFSTDSVPVPLSVNFLALPKEKQQAIRLKVDATNSGLLTLKRTQLDSLPPIYELWLMDRYKKDSLDLRNNDTYAFDVNKGDTASFGNNRFQIVVRQNKALGLHLLDFTAVKATNGVPITWKTENEESYTNFTVERSTDNGVTFDVLGGFASNNQHVYTFLDANPVKTVDLYRLKLEDLNGTISYSKVITIVYDASKLPVASTKISVYPNPSKGVINLAISQSNPNFANLSGIQSVSYTPSLASAPAQLYAIKIVNITGSVIKTATSATPNWQDDVSSLLPGTYFIQVLNKSDNSLVGKSSFVKL